MQPEHAVDRPQLGRLDHLRVRHYHRMKVALERLAPEIQEALKLREVRTQIVGLPHEGLQKPGMIRTTVKDGCGRQAIAGDLLLEVSRCNCCHSAPPPRRWNCRSGRQ